MESMLERIRAQVAARLQAARDLIASRNQTNPNDTTEDPENTDG